MDRYVNVISGLPRTGKTTLLENITGKPEYKGAVIVRMDEVGNLLWRERQAVRKGSTDTELTPTEKVYRNEATRNEIKKQLIVKNAGIVFSEMPLLTRQYHQRPLVEIVSSAEWYIQGIEKDIANRNSPPSPVNPSRVHLNVVLLYASPDIVRERVEKDKENPRSKSDAGHINIFLDAALKFEFPDCYPYLLVDTTDESLGADQQRIEEVIAFLMGSISPQELASLNFERMPEAVADLEEARRQAEIAGIKRL